MPRLQQRADGRFRRVLSERIIFHGEQSLDYAQGLLVYIAWYPMHQRPLRNQLFQFMQIAMTMVSDLRLAQQVHDKEALNASIACYNLSCLLNCIHERPRNGPTADCFDLAAHIMPGSDEDVGIQHTRLLMLHEEVSSYKPDMNHQDIASRCSLETREAVRAFYKKIDALDSVLPPTIQDNIPFRLSRLCLKVRIAFLPLKPLQSDRAQRHNTQLPDPEIQSLATTCFSEVQEFLEALLSIPLDQYIYFSTREWCQIIMTISTASKLCFSHLAYADVTETRAFQIKTRAKMLIYLESLAHRMGNLSVTPILSTKYPDFFCLFKSVLEIITPTYAPPPSSYQPADIGTGTCPVTHQDQMEPYHQEMDAQGTSPSASRCPILNGTIKDTDFWRALEQSTPISDESLGDGLADLQGNDIGQISMDPSDWSTVFSDWVVDLNNMPE
ncbi:hypothetical protein N7499_006869 [Penicillium canescens]|uniref:Transcription factor domain-containing protein n=1 Tax=Penicillium canescens TaxID=5083 RepID=A0AAD6NAU5_PENCN|nr:uncharacterized protein N7446_002558 [Penicillium canescens]KAJ6044365.1 hypothetical protein N7460_005720 [Penicillium canescens]KAJ6055833.1 hypothetical protein N7444_004931 [Penicillium canescens]KAJ6074781.1 hypothetical protein N7446_002558 [Penicillium canescens]KAJ6081995.1 hypothetical protein N7499_006869 [Penicillium canescens]KAJ6176208.1 hypothetical protein N7485_003122 [Penicillium canescens]